MKSGRNPALFCLKERQPMLRSCQYCGRIHATTYDCGKKPVRVKKRTDANDFRSTYSWKKKRNQIKERDNYLCQICIRNLYGTENRLNGKGIGVHHAVPLEEDFEKRCDDDYLISICDMHHEQAESGAIPRKIILDIIREQNEKYGEIPPG